MVMICLHTCCTRIRFLKQYIKGKDKVIPVQAVEGPYGCERLRLPHFQTIGSPMAARLLALRAGGLLPPG
jgi:hypothetical protein